MKYFFCDQYESICMGTEKVLVPSYSAKQATGSVPGYFYTNSVCSWIIGVPNEWTDNSIVKIRISKLNNATCFVNTGGTLTTANNEIQCY